MTRRLARIRRHLHWWTAALVIVGFAIAWLMTALPVSELLTKFLLYQLHKSLGLCVSGLAALRLVLAWRAGDRPGADTGGTLRLTAVGAALGYLTAAASPTAVPTLFFLMLNVPHAIAPDAGSIRGDPAGAQVARHRVGRPRRRGTRRKCASVLWFAAPPRGTVRGCASTCKIRLTTGCSIFPRRCGMPQWRARRMPAAATMLSASAALNPDFASAMTDAEALICDVSVIKAQFPCPTPRLQLLFVTNAGLDRLAPFDWLPPGCNPDEQPRHARR